MSKLEYLLNRMESFLESHALKEQVTTANVVPSTSNGAGNFGPYVGRTAWPPYSPILRWAQDDNKRLYQIDLAQQPLDSEASNRRGSQPVPRRRLRPKKQEPSAVEGSA